MKVRQKTIYASPTKIVSEGEVHDVPDAEAKLLIEGGYAEKVKADKADGQ